MDISKTPICKENLMRITLECGMGCEVIPLDVAMRLEHDLIAWKDLSGDQMIRILQLESRIKELEKKG